VAAARIVLTTGANSGLGLATVVALARAGYDSVGSVRTAAKAGVVREAARQAGVEVRTVILDVTDEAACRRVVNRLKPYALVNNAGYSASGAIEDVTDTQARAALETMVVAPMRLARLALPHMRRRRQGRIVNMSSVYGRTTSPLTGWYQAAKHALEALSDALRVETAQFGVKVVLIEPGGFDTGIWDAAQGEIAGRTGSHYATAYSRVRAGIRLSRPLMGDPAQVGKVVVTAVRSSRPRFRYLVGLDAQALAVVDQVVPGQLRDRVVRLALGL
jgi:NAD(P)-dependent dehydrogenase (short-subunit alcohol dehydrogenase family)